MARQMKDSGVEWIGEIPEGWHTCKIKDIFQVFSGATPKSEQAEYWDGDIIWVTPADYKTSDKFVSCGKRTITQAGYNSCGTTLVPAGSIVFSKRAPIGSVAIAKVPLCTNQGCLSCINKGDADTIFFYYVMSIFTEIFELYGSGTTFKELSYDSFTAFAMTNPPLSEQHRIAAFLDRRCAEIDAVIERTKATIEEYKKLKQAVITEAVTKGVRGLRPMKDSGIEWIGEIPEGWEVSRVKYVSDFEPSSRRDDLSDESIITYTPMDCIKNGWFINNTAPLGSVSSSLTAYQEGDIVLAKVTPCFENGNIAIMKGLASGFGLGSSELFVIRAESIDTKYMFYWLRNEGFMQRACATMTGTGGLKRVSPAFVKDCFIHMPPATEQAEIVAYLDEKCAALDTLIAKKTALLTELEAYKKSLIYEYVTGKREVQ